MRLDRVLIGIYEWFRKILWAEKQEESAGYQIILTKTNIDGRPILGVLQLIGRNTPEPNTPNTCLLYTSDAADE